MTNAWFKQVRSWFPTMFISKQQHAPLLEKALFISLAQAIKVDYAEPLLIHKLTQNTKKQTQELPEKSSNWCLFKYSWTSSNKLH